MVGLGESQGRGNSKKLQGRGLVGDWASCASNQHLSQLGIHPPTESGRPERGVLPGDGIQRNGSRALGKGTLSCGRCIIHLRGGERGLTVL